MISQRRCSRSGVTLVETLIALSIGTMLIGVVWGIFGAGIRSYKRAEQKSGMHLAALLAVEAIERDLASIFIDRKGVEQPIEVSNKGQHIRFHRARSKSSDLLRVYDTPVTYEVSAKKDKGWAFLLRDGKAVRGVQLLDGHFDFLPASEENGQVHLLRFRFRACDANGNGLFPMIRLFALDGPTRLWRQVKGGKRAF